MHAIARADDRNPFSCRPPGEMLQIEVAACRARIFGMDMQVGVEGRAHRDSATSTPKKRQGYLARRRPKCLARKTPIKSAPAPTSLRPAKVAVVRIEIAQDEKRRH